VAYALVRIKAGLVSAGSLALAVAFPLAFFGYTRVVGLTLVDHWPLQAVSAALGLVILVRHRENIVRLVRGEEMGGRGASVVERDPRRP
jgi:glycerol-3-phosphate acyltransferase PlsY